MWVQKPNLFELVLHGARWQTFCPKRLFLVLGDPNMSLSITYELKLNPRYHTMVINHRACWILQLYFLSFILWLVHRICSIKWINDSWTIQNTLIDATAHTSPYLQVWFTSQEFCYVFYLASTAPPQKKNPPKIYFISSGLWSTRLASITVESSCRLWLVRDPEGGGMPRGRQLMKGRDHRFNYQECTRETHDRM